MGIIIDDGGSFRPRPRYAKIAAIREGPRPELTRRDRVWCWTHRWRRPDWAPLQRDLLAAVEPQALARAYARARAVDPLQTALVLVRDHRAWTTGTLQVALADLPSLFETVCERLGEGGERVVVAEGGRPDGDAPWQTADAQRVAAAAIVSVATTQWPRQEGDVGRWCKGIAGLLPHLQAAVQWPEETVCQTWTESIRHCLTEVEVTRIFVIPGSPSAFSTFFWTEFSPRQRWTALTRHGVWDRVTSPAARAGSGRGRPPQTGGAAAGATSVEPEETLGQRVPHARAMQGLGDERLRDDIWYGILRDEPVPGARAISSSPVERQDETFQLWEIHQRWQQDLRQLVAVDSACGGQIGALACSARTMEEWRDLGVRLCARGQYVVRPRETAEELGSAPAGPAVAMTVSEVMGWQWLLTHCPPAAVPLLWGDLWVTDYDLAQIMSALGDPSLLSLGLRRDDVARLLRHEERLVRVFALRVLALLGAEPSSLELIAVR